MTVGIINYGSGNIYSVSNALKKINIKNKIISSPLDIKNTPTILLPGVGNFKSCIKKFKDKNFLDSTLEHVNKNKKLIGICVGMQMLFDFSEEDGNSEGMSLINGKVTLLNPNKINEKKKFRLPNMGWSSVNFNSNEAGRKMSQNINKPEFYFAHSYACRLDNNSHEVATSKYGDEKFLTIVANKNIIGIQFHPEKSGPAGLELLKNILKD